MKVIITDKEKEMFDLTDKDIEKIGSYMRQGCSKAEALIKMGKAVVHKVDCNTEKATKKATTPREKKIDPVKSYILGIIKTALESATTYKVEHLFTDDTKTIDFNVDGESYTITITKHKKKA